MLEKVCKWCWYVSSDDDDVIAVRILLVLHKTAQDCVGIHIILNVIDGFESLSLGPIINDFFVIYIGHPTCANRSSQIGEISSDENIEFPR